jgi:hypothetical protein
VYLWIVFKTATNFALTIHYIQCAERKRSTNLMILCFAQCDVEHMIFHTKIITCSIYECKRICFIVLLIVVLSLEIQLSQRRSVIPLTNLIPPHFYECITSGPGIPMPYIVVLCVFNCEGWDLVDIGASVDHHCFKLSFDNN